MTQEQTMIEVYFELTIFGEGGDGAAGTAGADTGQQPAGAQAEGAANEETQARRADFDKFIADNKDLYEERLKQQLDRRMKTATRDMDALKGMNARYDALAQAIAQRYGKDAADLDALEKAVREDESWLEEQAARNGLTVEQQKHMNALEAENQRFKAAREAAERQAQREATLSRWQAEAEALKAKFPDFNLEAEIGNKDFTALLGNGVNMETAYMVCHHDELVSGAMQYAVNRATDAVAASVRANGLRPTEGAGTSSAPSAMSMDVNKMTRDQREELKKRALRGERITLG